MVTHGDIDFLAVNNRQKKKFKRGNGETETRRRKGQKGGGTGPSGMTTAQQGTGSGPFSHPVFCLCQIYQTKGKGPSMRDMRYMRDSTYEVFALFVLMLHALSRSRRRCPPITDMDEHACKKAECSEGAEVHS